MKNPKEIKNISWKFRDSAKVYPELKNKTNIKIDTSEIFYKTFKFLFRNEVRERFLVFWINLQSLVIGFEIISEGILDSTVVHPREVFRGAIVASCNAIILAHNHPSGNPEPSNADILITKKIVESGKIIDIKVLDHIIFTNTEYNSFADKLLI